MFAKNAHDIAEVKQWLEGQNFLPKDLSEDFIFTFLWGCEGDISRTKRVLSNYFYARQSIPEIFTRRDPYLKENVAAWKNSCFLPLKEKQNGCRIFLGACLSKDNYDFVAFVKQVFMCYDLLLKNNEWDNGDRVVILSYSNIGYENLSTYTIYITRKTTECEREEYLPGKLRAVHNVNLPNFMKKIYDRFEPYLRPEDIKVIQFHKTLRSLHRYINPEILPMEFGGRAGPLRLIADNWYDILKTHRQFFIEEEEKRRLEVRVITRKAN